MRCRSLIVWSVSPSSVVFMRFRKCISFSLLLLSSLPIAAKDKKKILLTDDVLQATTVFVIADPNAGVDAADPLANRNARLDVESALRKWGRFQVALDPYSADLVIVVRRGSGKLARQTIGGIPISNEPVLMQAPAPGNIPDNRPVSRTASDDPMGSQQQMGPSPQLEIGAADDMLSVYRGHRNNPTESSAVWRYSAKDALRSPAVRAVEEFRKVIDEAEKQRAAKP
jgi:hypothetical protein